MKKGQHVKVINTGRMYTSYDEMANILGISDYINNHKDVKNFAGEKGIIINFRQHTLDKHIIVLAIYIPKFKRTILIGSKGLKMLPDPVILPNELFEI